MASRVIRTIGAAILGLAVLPAPAMADDPNDPTMQTPEAVARDREMIRQMNLDMLDQVSRRDRAYAQGWKAYRLAKQDSESHARRLADYEREQARYAHDRERYEQAMADWRKDVAACRAGYYAACD